MCINRATSNYAISMEQLLNHWDTGILRKELNEADAKLGHGRLRSAGGNYLDIGGSTGNSSSKKERTCHEVLRCFSACEEEARRLSFCWFPRLAVYRMEEERIPEPHPKVLGISNDGLSHFIFAKYSHPPEVGAVHSHCGSTARSQGTRPEAQRRPLPSRGSTFRW